MAEGRRSRDARDDDLLLRRFVDRRVLVVGAGTGIGLATARRVAAEGGSVVVADLDEAPCVAAVASLAGGGHRTAGVDVTSRSSVDALVASLDRLDVLVHVSGGDRPRPCFTENDSWPTSRWTWRPGSG